MSTFKRAKLGEPLAIPAAAYNAFCDAGEAFARDGRRRGGGSLAGFVSDSALIVTIKNETGRDLRAGDACWLAEDEDDNVLDDDRYEAMKRPYLRAVFRTGFATSRWEQQFAVAVSPIPIGDFGQAVIQGVCAAYIHESAVDSNYDGIGVNGGRYAIPIQSKTGFTAETCTLGRCNTLGPVEVLTQLSAATETDNDGDYIEFSDDRLYLVNISRVPYCTRVMVNDAGGFLNSILSRVTYTESNSRRSHNDVAVGGDPVTEEGFYKSFSTTAPSTSISALNNNGIVNNSVLRVPTPGVYDIDVSVFATLTHNGVSGTAALPAEATTVGFTRLTYAAQVVVIDEDGAEVTGFFPVWPAIETDRTLSPYGADVAQNYLMYFGAAGATAVLGSTTARGSFSGKCRLHLREHLRVGVRIRCRETSAVVSQISSTTIEVFGNLQVQPALPEIYLHPANVVIVGTPDSPTSYAYGLNSTGTGTLPGITISSYAWKVWGPNGTTWTSTGSSYSDTFNDGEGEYVARLLVTYSDGSTGGAEHRFTLPNA